MTLLELLVKELPGRGGWSLIFKSDHNWEIVEKFIENYKLAYGIDSKCKQYVESEETGEIVTREQYQAAISSQQPAWNGEGLPPVGCECEYETIKDNWRKCRVMYLGEKCNIVRTDEWGEVSCGLSVKFRPIRTEAECKREEFGAACILLNNSKDWSHSTEFFSGLYDEIAAGKIPGVYIK